VGPPVCIACSDIIEGGICVRRVEDLLTETEKRFFIIKGKPYSPVSDEPIPEIILNDFGLKLK
jgi:hypothetical protein